MFSSTLALKADQEFVAFAAAFGCGGIKRHLLPPFCMATFLIFSRAVALLCPAHCVCMRRLQLRGKK